MKSIYLDKNQMEIKDVGTMDFPFRIDRERIYEYESRRVHCHWHKPLEFIIIRSGQIKCKINKKEYTLSEGDCLFVNTNIFHMFWSVGEEDCAYSAILVSPAIFARENNRLRQKYIDRILECPSLESFVFRSGNNWKGEIAGKLHMLDRIYEQKQDCYELEIISLMLSIWRVFYLNTQEYISQERAVSENDKKVKGILTYLHSHYQDKISLENIARHAGASKSTCSHIFKAYMKESPFEYLMHYRIDKSLPLLADEDRSITETAMAVGFSGSSYYTEIFKRYMNMTPMEYKKQKK